MQYFLPVAEIGGFSGGLHGFVDAHAVHARHGRRLRVYFEDTDLSGIVYHANYLRYMERGRTNYLRLIGADHRKLFEETGLLWRRAGESIDTGVGFSAVLPIGTPVHAGDPLMLVHARDRASGEAVLIDTVFEQAARDAAL